MSQIILSARPFLVNDPSALPAWRVGMAQWEWIELLGTSSLSGAAPSDTSSGMYGPGGGLAGRLNAWNGFATLGKKVYLSGAGGHGDWWGCETYQCDLDVATPMWEILPGYTVSADITHDGSGYQADGRPISAHLYYSSWGIGNQIIRMGAFAAAPSAGDYRQVDAYDLSDLDWKPADTYPDVPDGGYSRAMCQGPDGTMYYVGASYLYKRHPTTGVFVQLEHMPDNGSATAYRSAAFDTTRNRIAIFGDTYNMETPDGLLYDVATDTWSSMTISGDDAATLVAWAGHSAWYDASRDRFIFKTDIGDDVYLIHPETWVSTAQATTGGGSIVNAANGVFNKFIQVSDLGGCFYQPRYSSNAWFLATA